MPTTLRILFTVLALALLPLVAAAAPLKTHVAEFAVMGAGNKDELKSALPGMLASRLDQNQLQLVEKPEQAELLIQGSYAQFGKLFSIDILLKNTVSGSIAKVFEQGDSQDELLPAISRLSQKISQHIPRFQTAGPSPTTLTTPSAAPSATPVSPASVPAAQAQVVPKPAPAPLSYKVEAAPPAAAEERYVVKSGLPRQNSPGSWSSEPIDGVFSSLALGRTLPSGEREIFLAGEQTLRYLRSSSDLKQISEISLPASAKILAIDTADLDRDGTPEVYVSIIDRKSVSSRIYQPTDKGLELLVDNQPWLYRGIGTTLADRAIFVQGVSASGDYQNNVAELAKNGRQFTTTSRTLPRHGTIYNFSRFTASDGTQKWVVVDEDGYLLVYGADGNQLWKSGDKFGGSETYFNYDTVAQQRSKSDKYRWNFLEQRIVALADGTLLVPRNDGNFNIGNNRSYSKHSLFGLAWSGAMLKEAWHTRQAPSYLADYAYDPASREVILLEIVQHPGLFASGKAVISINKLD